MCVILHLWLEGSLILLFDFFINAQPGFVYSLHISLDPLGIQCDMDSVNNTLAKKQLTVWHAPCYCPHAHEAPLPGHSGSVLCCTPVSASLDKVKFHFLSSIITSGYKGACTVTFQHTWLSEFCSKQVSTGSRVVEGWFVSFVAWKQNQSPVHTNHVLCPELHPKPEFTSLLSLI